MSFFDLLLGALTATTLLVVGAAGARHRAGKKEAKVVSSRSISLTVFASAARVIASSRGLLIEPAAEVGQIGAALSGDVPTQARVRLVGPVLRMAIVIVLLLSSGSLALITVGLHGKVEVAQEQARGAQEQASKLAELNGILTLGRPPQIFRHGSLTLSLGSSADLDSPPSDVQWRGIEAEVDIGYTGNGLTPESTALGASLSRMPASYSTCSSNLNYSSGAYMTSDIGVGDYFCWLTDNDRIATLKVQMVNQAHIVFDVTVYEPLPS